MLVSLLRRILQTWMTTFLFVSYTLVGSLFAFRALAVWPLVASLWAATVFVWAQWFLNDYYDYETDRLSNRERPTSDGSIGRDRLRPLFLLFTLLAGLPLVFVNGAALAAFVCVVLVNVAYSAPPLRLKARPLPSVLCLSAYTVGNGAIGLFAQEAPLDPLFFLAGAAAFVGGAVSVSYKDLKDWATDPASGVRNFVTIFGVRRMQRFLALAHAVLYLTAPLLFGIPFTLPVTAALAAVVVFLLLSYSVEKGPATVYRIDLVNGLLVQTCGWAIWARQLGLV